MDTLEAFNWIKNHYSQKKGIHDASELISFLTEKLLVCEKNFDPAKGSWENYYRATLHREHLKWVRMESKRAQNHAYNSEEGEFDHESAQLHPDELVIMAEFLSTLKPEEERILLALHAGIPKRDLAAHLGLAPATFYRMYLKLRTRVRTVRGVD